MPIGLYVHRERVPEAEDPCPLSLPFVLSSFVHRAAASLVFADLGNEKGERSGRACGVLDRSCILRRQGG
jgi:hypothetical protein